MLERANIRKVGKRVNEEKFTATKQLLLMMILTIVTQVVMLLKVSIVASSFGTSIEMDASFDTPTLYDKLMQREISFEEFYEKRRMG